MTAHSLPDRSAWDKHPPLQLAGLDPQRTLLIVVDMVNGFAKEGALASPRVAALIPGIRELMQACAAHGVDIVTANDTHHEASIEFRAFPPHCLRGTAESELVSELKTAGCGYTVLPKNSTNAAMTDAMRSYLDGHPAYENYMLVGDCTDICILNLALSLKTEASEADREARVIVPASLVDTFDAPGHPGDLLHAAALMLMEVNGVEVPGRIALAAGRRTAANAENE